MNVVFCFCMFSGSSLLFWAETWVKIGSKIAPNDSANYEDRACHVIKSLMQTRHSRFSSPRVHVVHASASLVLFQSARSREPCSRVTAI
ncbi:uncharacterized protein DS421_14g469260 [Arachis hypogaea]|nr:uncharacterized protein DS421_14g469260 [Arachis hypogaea]